MITRQQVADLRVGDIVQIEGWYGLTVQGPVSDSLSDGSLWLGQHIRLTYTDGDTGNWLKSDEAHLVLIARAPSPLYVNHPRTEPVPGDVVRIEFDEPYDDDSCVNVYLPDRTRPHDPWLSIRHDEGMRYSSEQVLPGPTTKGRAVLLVDGTTGQVVPS